MKQPQKPSEPSEDENLDLEFEKALLELEEMLFSLKERYNQVKADKYLQIQLKQRLQDLNIEKRQSKKTNNRKNQRKNQRNEDSDSTHQQRLGKLNPRERSPFPEIKAEFLQIQNQLQALEINLESRLFSWNSLREPFWQVIRFGGLGVIIGWLLKSCVG
jgi:hypothetical protein